MSALLFQKRFCYSIETEVCRWSKEKQWIQKTEVKSMENKKIKVALLGLGTVGGGVYKLIQRRSESMIHTVAPSWKWKRSWYTV